jgi:hypothetical protein
MYVSEPTPTASHRVELSLRTRLRVCVSPVLLLWLFGMVSFLRADGSMQQSLPRREPPPVGEHNVASFRYGPTLRASSYFRQLRAHHHPMFLVDEQSSPSGIEKWASAPYDQAPWLEIEWREPRKLQRVVVSHAGLREDPRLNARSYRLRCLRDAPAPVLEVRDNTDSIATHAFACEGARGVRLEWPLKAGEQARAYEIEAWGQ